MASGEFWAYSGLLSLEPVAVSNGCGETWGVRLTRACALGLFPEALHGDVVEESLERREGRKVQKKMGGNAERRDWGPNKDGDLGPSPVSLWVVSTWQPRPKSAGSMLQASFVQHKRG